MNLQNKTAVTFSISRSVLNITRSSGTISSSHSELQATGRTPPIPQQLSYCVLLLCGKLVWKLKYEFLWLHCKAIHQLLFCCISYKAAAQEMSAVDLNRTTGNQGCCQINQD